MFNKELGYITVIEKEEILLIFERKCALKELINALDSQSYSDKEKEKLSIKILSDLEDNKTVFESWISNISKKYNWKIGNGVQWRMDFDTSKISIKQ
jgi:CXXX repeat modification system protein